MEKADGSAEGPEFDLGPMPSWLDDDPLVIEVESDRADSSEPFGRSRDLFGERERVDRATGLSGSSEVVVEPTREVAPVVDAAAGPATAEVEPVGRRMNPVKVERPVAALTRRQKSRQRGRAQRKAPKAVAVVPSVESRVELASAEPGPVLPSRSRMVSTVLWGAPLLLLLMVGSLFLLARWGADAFLDSRGGQVSAELTDPTAVGYQAVVEPTPSMFVAMRGRKSTLVGAALITLGRDDRGGTLIVIPPETLIGDSQTTLGGAFVGGGEAALESALTDLLGVRVGSVEVVDRERWTSLTAPVSPLPVDIPDDLFEANGLGENVVRFAAGTSSLEASDVGEYLAWVNPGESSVNQLARQTAFWQRWLDAIAQEGEASVPGEVDVGLGRFLRALAVGPSEIRQLPVTVAAGSAGAELETFTPRAADLTEMVSEMFPFPVGRPGERPLIRLLDGVGDREQLLAVAQLLVDNGGQIAILGNADEFGQPATRVVQHAARADEAAATMAQAVGVSGIEADFAEEIGGEALQVSYDLTIVLGTDYTALN